MMLELMMRLLFALTLLSTADWNLVAAESVDTVVVTTKLGDIRGVSEDGVWAFHGVPFAEPPIGDLRWRAPQAKTPWSPSEYDGTYHRSACPQHCGQVYCIKEMSEDCLYLEIYAPAGVSETSGLAVDVYLHGGAFDSMSAASPMYNPTRFVQRAGVIVVLVEYRLGALGFLVTEGTGDDSSGNFGILDQILALQWVQENIESFGGDPSMVTLHGQSAGAQSIVIHMTSQLSSQYFRSAISESNPIALSYKTKSEALELGKHLAQSLGCLTDNDIVDMACMKNTDAFDILDKQGDVRGILPDYLDRIQPFAPVLDDEIMPLTPLAALREYSSTTPNPIPIIWGVTSEESRSYVLSWLDKPVPSIAFLLVKLLLFSATATKEYPITSSDAREDIITLATDGLFRCPVRAAVNLFHDNGNDAVWVFEWAHLVQSEAPEDYQKYTEKAYHGIQVPFVFQSFPALNVTVVDADMDVSNTIIDYYANFIKFGDPNGDKPKRRKRDLNERKLPEDPSRSVLKRGVDSRSSLTYWPPARANANKFTTLVFNQGVRVNEATRDPQCDLWDRQGYEIDLSGLGSLIG